MGWSGERVPLSSPKFFLFLEVIMNATRIFIRVFWGRLAFGWISKFRRCVVRDKATVLKLVNTDDEGGG